MSKRHSRPLSYGALSSAIFGGALAFGPTNAAHAGAESMGPDEIARPATVVQGTTQRVGADNVSSDETELRLGDRVSATQNLGLTKGNFKRLTDRFPSGRLKSGLALPLKKFRVGPLFGRVGGPHSGGVHSGLDFGAPINTPVRTASDGRVEVAAWQGAAGKAVTIKTRTGHRVLYGHLNQIDVKTGQKVAAGDVIGRVGSTGNSTGPHLHIGVHRKDGTLIDPIVWMKTSVKELLRHGRN